MSVLIPHYYIGLDLGKKCDYTAMAVVERREGGSPHFLTPWTVPATAYELRHLERVPLGTPYPKVVKMVGDLTRAPLLHRRCTLVLDETGVGAPVVDLLRQAGLDCDLVPVTITGGEHANRSAQGWSVPKRDLMTTLMVMVEDEELRIAGDLPERRRLVEELIAMREGTGASGRSVYGAKGRKHDDLVLAVSLACWRAKAGTVGWQQAGRVVR